MTNVYFTHGVTDIQLIWGYETVISYGQSNIFFMSLQLYFQEARILSIFQDSVVFMEIE